MVKSVRTKLYKIIAIMALTTLTGLVAVIIWRESQWNQFNSAIDEQGGTFVTEWKGPNWIRLRGICHSNGFRGFYVVKELYVGASPSQPIACLPPDGLFIYQLNNEKFDDGDLETLLRLLPTPEAVDRVEISNCELTPSGIMSLQKLENLSYVLWAQPQASRQAVQQVSRRLPFDISSFWPGDCTE